MGCAVEGLLIGAILDIVGSAAGGVLAGLTELTLRRRANRARTHRNEPTVRNEVLLPLWMPGAIAGAVIGVIAIGSGGWVRAALLALFFPIVARFSLRILALLITHQTFS
jgi:hypothetical protein